MSTTEHLKKIRARCVELLEIASKRKPGGWEPGNGAVWASTKDESQNEVCEFCEDEDATFIASCAGAAAAEAGWRATIVAIDSCLADDPKYQEMYNLVNLTMIETIIAAWPEELL